MGDGESQDAPARAPGLLPDADWDQVGNLGVVDVLFVTTPGTDLVSAVVVLRDGCGHIHPWALAERESMQAARGAVRFLLQGLAELRRRTGQAYPWVEDETKSEVRHQALTAAIDRWREQADAAAAAVRLPPEEARRALLGAPVWNARKAKGLTQAALAEQTGIKVAWLSQIERGRRTPTAAQRARIAEALEVDPRDFEP